MLVGAALLAAAPASAAPLEPWDGVNPFDCEVQDVGMGVAFPDPDADPFCVQFDKTGQNLTELGVVDFLTKEPARVAAAVDKCSYYQRDHWTGSVVQDDPATETYNFQGRYYFDKSTGAGGVYIEDFRLLGMPADPRSVPRFPAELSAYFTAAGGGAQSNAMVPADPRCSATDGDPGPGPDPDPAESECVDARGEVTRAGIGRARLGRSRDETEEGLGEPRGGSGDFSRYCADPGEGRLVIGFRQNGSAYTATNVSRARVQGVHPGDPADEARRELDGERRRGRLLLLARRGANLVLRRAGGRIESVGVAIDDLSHRRLSAFADRAG